MAVGNTSFLQLDESVAAGLTSFLQIDGAPVGPSGLTSFLQIDGTPIVTIPAAPGTVAGDAVDDMTAGITWVDNSLNEDGFVVELESPAGSGNWVPATGSANPTAAGAQVFFASGLTAATRYTPRVAALNAAGQSAWAVGTAFSTDNVGSGGSEIPTEVEADLSLVYNIEAANVSTVTSDLSLVWSIFSNSGNPHAVWEGVVIEDGLTAGDILRLILAAVSGRTEGLGTRVENYLSRDGTKVRISANFDGRSNRESVDLDPSP